VGGGEASIVTLSPMSDRQQRRERRRRRAGKDDETSDLGNGVEVATAEAVMRAVGSLPRDLDWAEVEGSVIPVLPRRRPFPSQAGEPFRVTLPPGIPTGFGIDIGPAFLVVGEALLAGWDIGPADLVARALSNVRDRLRPVRPRDLFAQSFDGVPVRVLQTGVGCASAMVLLPDELRRILGEDAQVLIAPMRDLLISLPADVDRRFAAWLTDELSSMDPNGLALDAFLLDAGGLRYERLPGLEGLAR
jgi:hypothetical protein